MKLVHLLPVIFLALLIGIPAQAEGPGWVLASEKNGIRVYRKLDDESRIKTFRGVTRFPIENPAGVEALLQDYDAAPRWLHFVSSATEMSRRSSMENLVYVRIELPWPLADRDLVANLQFEKTGANTLLLRARNDSHAPVNEDYLRIPNFNAVFRMEFSEEMREVEITYEVVMDPGGKVPAWAINLVLKDQPYFTLMKISRLVDEPKYANAKGKFLDYAW